MKEILSLRIKNFQTHKDTFIEFCAGLNVFVGESRNGKTAILRILRWIYYNEPRGDRFIRIGEDQCEGEVFLADGVSVQRIRSSNGKINCYVLNEPGKEEQVFTKFGVEVPLDIQRALGVSKLYLDKDTSIELNFSRQMDAAFLVSDSAARRTKIIGRVVNLHVIDSANRSAEKDLKAANRKKSELEEDLKSLQEKIVAFDDLPDKETALKRAFELLTQADALKVKADKLQEIETVIQRVQLAIVDNNNKLNILKDINIAENMVREINSKGKIVSCLEETHFRISASLADLSIQTNLLNKLSDLETAVISFNEIAKKVGRLANLQSIEQQISSTQSSLQTQQGILAKLQLLDDASTGCSAIKKKINSLITFSELNERITDNEQKLQLFSALLDKTKNIERGQEVITALYRLREKGAKLAEINARVKSTKAQLLEYSNVSSSLSKVDEVCSLINQMQNKVNRLNNLETLDLQCKKMDGQYKESIRKTADLETKYFQLLKDYTGALKENGICPTCHTIMSEQVITQLQLASGL
jgi:exonuclease SbcC